MANPSTLYRFRIQVADTDRGCYEDLDLRIAMHPSENSDFLITRVLAYALSYEEGLEFNPQGLAEPEFPCIQIKDLYGGYKLWIEIGNPSAKKAHKASKASEKLCIYTYKDPQNLLRDLRSNNVHRLPEIQIFSLTGGFLQEIAGQLARDNSWTVTRTDGSLLVSIGEKVVEGELHLHRPDGSSG